MVFIPITDMVLLVAQFQDQEGVLAINRHYMGTTSVPTETDLDECLAAYTDWMTESYQPVMESNWSLTGVVARAMNEEFGIEKNAVAGVPQNGAVGSGRLPNQVSYTITWQTGFVGRSFRGRTFAVGCQSAFISAGQKRLTPEGRAALEGIWVNLLTIMEAAGHAMNVVSLVEGGVPRSAGVSTPVLSGRVNFPVATQRRRLR